MVLFSLFPLGLSLGLRLSRGSSYSSFTFSQASHIDGRLTLGVIVCVVYSVNSFSLLFASRSVELTYVLRLEYSFIYMLVVTQTYIRIKKLKN